MYYLSTCSYLRHPPSSLSLWSISSCLAGLLLLCWTGSSFPLNKTVFIDYFSFMFLFFITAIKVERGILISLAMIAHFLFGWLSTSAAILSNFLFGDNACRFVFSATCSILNPRLIWVCLQQPSWTLDMHDRRSRTGSFSCFFTSENRKKYQERSGEYGGCGSSCTSLTVRKSTGVKLLLGVHWHCHDEEKGHGVPSSGGAGTKLRRPSGDSDARTSPLWLS